MSLALLFILDVNARLMQKTVVYATSALIMPPNSKSTQISSFHIRYSRT